MRNNIILLKFPLGSKKKTFLNVSFTVYRTKLQMKPFPLKTKKNSLQYILIHFFLFPFLSSLNFRAYSFSLGQSLSFPIKVTSRQEVRFAKIRSTFWDAGGGGPNFTSLLLFVCVGERVGADVGGCLTTR